MEEFRVAFMGETSEIGVAELLSVLAHRGHTGRLTIISDDGEVQIYLAGGKVILVSSSNHALRLGRILLRLGILDASNLDAAVREQDVQGGKRPLGQILLDAGWVTKEDLERAAEEQCVEALTRVIVANHGTFMFTRDARPKTKTGLVALKTDRIVLEASRRADEMMTLRSLLPPASSPLTITPKSLNRSEDMPVLERQVLDQLANQTGTLVDLSERISTEEVSLWRAVVNLHERGMIDARSIAEDDDQVPIDLAPARTLEEVVRLGALEMPTPPTKVPSLADVRAGTPAGSQSIVAITLVVREVIASFNAGLTLRAFASFSDDHFRRQGPLPAEDIEALRGPVRPLRAEEQETFLAVRDVRVLRDGRISAILHTHVPVAGECKKVLVFARGSDTWQIDAVIEAPNPSGSTMTSILALSADPTLLSAQAVRSR